MPHRIRLRKPWTRRALSGNSDVSACLSVDVPDLQTDAPSGSEPADVSTERVVYQRRFNRPSGLQAATRVELEIGEISGRLVHVQVNSVVVRGEDASATQRLNITDQITAHNQLEIEIQSSSPATHPPRIVGEVNLWIVDQDK